MLFRSTPGISFNNPKEKKTSSFVLICIHSEYLVEIWHKYLNWFCSFAEVVYWPMFTVAVLASIIASQAMISATFAIVKQSMALGCFPRVKVVHTSSNHEGQVYIPEINFLLLLACVFVTASFKDTTNIGNAYGKNSNSLSTFIY